MKILSFILGYFAGVLAVGFISLLLALIYIALRKGIWLVKEWREYGDLFDLFCGISLICGGLAMSLILIGGILTAIISL